MSFDPSTAQPVATGFDPSTAQEVRTPADATPQMQDAQWGAQNPYLRALQDTANQTVGRVGKEIYSNIPGISANVPPQVNQVIQNYHPENISTNPVSNEASNLLGAAASAVPSIALASPIYKAAGVIPKIPMVSKAITQGASAMAGYGGLSAASQGQPVIPAVVHGAEQGATMGALGKLGSAMGGKITQPLSESYNPNANWWGAAGRPLGTAAGMGIANAIHAPTGQKGQAFAVGAGLGLNNPEKTNIPDTPDEAIQSSVENAFNKGIKPASYGGSQSAVQRQGYLNQATTAVKAALSDPSNLETKDAQGNVTGTIDLNGGRQALSQIISNHLNNTFAKYDAMKQAAEGQGVTIPVTDLATQLKLYANSGVIKANPTLFSPVAKYAEGIATDMINKKEYTPSEAQDFLKHINSITDYNPNTAQTPGANAVNRQIADYFRKNMDDQISQNSDPRYQQLKNEYAAGKTVQKDIERSAQKQEKQPEITGGLGTMLKVYKGISGVVKGFHGDPMGTVEDLGEAAAIHGMQRANNPDLVVSKMMKKVSGILASKPTTSFTTPPMGESRNPNVQYAQLVPRQIGASMNPVAGALGYDRVGAYGASRMAEEQPGMVTPVSRPSGMPINQVPNPGALGLGQSGIGTPNEPAQTYPNTHQVIPMNGEKVNTPNVPAVYQDPYLNARNMSLVNDFGVKGSKGKYLNQEFTNPGSKEAIPMGSPSMSKVNPVSPHTMQGAMEFTKGLTPEQLKAAEKAVKIEKIIRS